MRKIAVAVALLSAWVVALGVSMIPNVPREALAQSTSGKVQGLVPAGTASGSSVNPVVIGYVDTSTNTVVFAVADLLGQRVHGVTTNGGSLTGVRPILMGGTDGAVARSIVTDTSGRIYPAGSAEGSAPSGGPLQIGGRDGAGNMRTLPVTVSGAAVPSNVLPIAGVTSGAIGQNLRVDAGSVLYTAQWISPLDTLTNLTPTASNGTTNVTLQAAAGGVRVYVGSLLFSNGSSTVAHTVTLTDTAGGTVAGPVSIPAGSSGVIGENGGLFQTAMGTGLRFKIDSGGTGTDVTCSGVIVVK